MSKRRGELGWQVFMALGGLASACGEGGPGAAGGPQAYTGVIEATDARVALVEQGEQVRAYVCGGPATYATLSRWYTLTAAPTAEGTRAVAGQADGWWLTGEIDAQGARGTLRGPDGAARAWSASIARGDSGLYEASDDLGKIGAIVEGQPAGEPAVQGTLLGKGGYRAQVTPVRPVSLPGDLRIQLQDPAGPLVRRLTPVLPSRER